MNKLLKGGVHLRLKLISFKTNNIVLKESWAIFLRRSLEVTHEVKNIPGVL